MIKIPFHRFTVAYHTDEAGPIIAVLCKLKYHHCDGLEDDINFP